MAITQSRRTAFVGAHIDPKTKDLVWRVVGRSGARSVSQFVSDAIEEKLVRDTPADDDNVSKKAQDHHHLRVLRKGIQ